MLSFLLLHQQSSLSLLSATYEIMFPSGFPLVGSATKTLLGSGTVSLFSSLAYFQHDHLNLLVLTVFIIILKTPTLFGCFGVMVWGQKQP